MRMILSALALGAFAFSAGLVRDAVAQDAGAERRFTSERIFDLEWASDPQIAPDGESAVYVRMGMDIMTDRRKGEIWSIDLETGDHRPLITGGGSYSRPRFSPDGGRLLHIASEDGKTELRVRYLDDGREFAFGPFERTPGAAAWSPDGTEIAFTQFVPDAPLTLAAPLKKPKGAEWADPVTVIDRVNFRVDGVGEVPPGRTHVFVMPAEGGAPRQLTSGDRDFGSPSWAPDGEAIYVSGDRDAENALNPLESELYRIDVASGEWTRLTTRDGADGSPAPSPDGSQIAYTGFDDVGTSDHQSDIYVMNADGSSPRNLTEGLDRDLASGPVWRPDGQALIFAYQDKGLTKLAQVALDGRVTDLAEDLGGQSIGRPYGSGEFAVGRTKPGGLLAQPSDIFLYTVGRADRPADIVMLRGRADRRERRVLTDLNGDLLRLVDMAAVEKITVPSSHDGLPIDAWIAKPPGFDPLKTYPMVLEIHGGPHTMYAPEFSAEVQRYAAEGFVTVWANPRGSTGYGEDFTLAIDKNYPSQDYDDLMSVVDAVIAEGYVDPDRLFVTGGSGGGVLTAWIVGKTDRFRAAVVAKPVINWVSEALSADIAVFVTKYWFTKPAWEDPEQYWKFSPLSLVGNVTTPTMLLTGSADVRTPMWETEQYYTALKLRGVDTAMVRVPGAFHGIASRPSQLAAKADNIIAWFKKYDVAQDGEDAPAPEQAPAQ